MLSQLHREVKCEKLCRLSFGCYVLRILFVSTNVLFAFSGQKFLAPFGANTLSKVGGKR